MKKDHYSQKIGEECGVFGIFLRDHVPEAGEGPAEVTYSALLALQHRGQQACGIAVGDRRLKQSADYKDLGLVTEVFTAPILSELKGDMGVGHVRYSPGSENTRENAQPLSIRYIKGNFSIVHNGNISNADALRRVLEMDGAIFQTTSDAEVIALLLARERLKARSIEEAVRKVLPRLEGSYSMIIMSPQKLIAVRDPLGIRPLCAGLLGRTEVFASESCALDAIGAQRTGDLRPGEIRVVRDAGVECIMDFCGTSSALCVFEHIYFARPDSEIDGQSVYEARLQAGRILARENPVEADLVVGVPDSGLTVALGYAEESGIPYGNALVKNRYIGRTFIQPEQSLRERSVAIKLNVVSPMVRGKRVIIIDDSIVRGTTIRPIVLLLRKAGVAEVHVRISSPPFLWPCPYGTDIPDRSSLASVQYSIEELCTKIGADSLSFLPLDKTHEMALHSTVNFCDACFTGDYPANPLRTVDPQK